MVGGLFLLLLFDLRCRSLRLTSFSSIPGLRDPEFKVRAIQGFSKIRFLARKKTAEGRTIRHHEEKTLIFPCLQHYYSTSTRKNALNASLWGSPKGRFEDTSHLVFFALDTFLAKTMLPTFSVSIGVTLRFGICYNLYFSLKAIRSIPCTKPRISVHPQNP